MALNPLIMSAEDLVRFYKPTTELEQHFIALIEDGVLSENALQELNQEHNDALALIAELEAKLLAQELV